MVLSSRIAKRNDLPALLHKGSKVAAGLKNRPRFGKPALSGMDLG